MVNKKCKVFRKGIDCLEITKPKLKGTNPWVTLTFRNRFSNKISGDIELYLEIIVLLAQSQPNWSLLLKV